MMPILTIDKLCVTQDQYLRQRLTHANSQSRLLLNAISCTVDAGEVMAIIGPNGAGKSTLLNTIAGDSKPTSGSITIKNQTIRARQVAVLPQLSLLNFPYQVHEVVGLARIPHCTGNQQDKQIIDQALAAMDISNLKHRLYTQLSGGEKQRVQLARVLAQIWRAEDAPDRLLLLDEPTAALDLGHQQQLMMMIKKFAQQGIAVVMVLHNINLAARYADKLLALLDGNLVAYGKVAEVITTETIKRLFNIEAQIIQHPKHPSPVVLGL